MQQRGTAAQKKFGTHQANPIETLKSAPDSMAKTASRALGEIGAGIGQDLLDTFFGSQDLSERQEVEKTFEHKTENFQKRGNFERLYDASEIAERREIEHILTKIHNEVEAIKNASMVLADEVKDVEKVTLSSAEVQPGIYHVRFLELILSFLHTLRLKIGESSTWLEAMQSKKKKRGSLFSSLSKKKGTQYSQSEEHKITRNTQ